MADPIKRDLKDRIKGNVKLTRFTLVSDLDKETGKMKLVAFAIHQFDPVLDYLKAHQEAVSCGAVFNGMWNECHNFLQNAGLECIG